MPNSDFTAEKNRSLIQITLPVPEDVDTPVISNPLPNQTQDKLSEFSLILGLFSFNSMCTGATTLLCCRGFLACPALESVRIAP
jgi:hypothetical protein